MANAEVYSKWHSQGDGARGGGAWSYHSDGTAVMGGRVNLPTQHAERIAWRTGWKAILTRVAGEVMTARQSDAETTAAALREAVRESQRTGERAKRVYPVHDVENALLAKRFQVKFWVDQMVCPTCQKWMVIDVISNLKLLRHKYGLRVELYAEVRTPSTTNKIRVKRSADWNGVGQIRRFEDIQGGYN